MKDFIVAIDGPAGSGKSTISKIVAKKKGFTYLDTGAMYRMVTLATIKKNVNVENKEEIVDLLKNIKLNIEKDKFYLGNEDVSEEIRGVEVTSNVSKVAAIKEVREELVRLQREISQGKNVILDGRDIGTVVFPNAQLKVFLVASSEERAKRRVKEFESKGINISYQEVLDEIIKRDKMDSTREESPLLQAEDAVLVDTSSMSIDEVSNKIVELVDNLF
ncbi:MAG: (d)CMP kinase [Fusobacteriaceae bacterium]|nr:(d)CMP kinase [Fusobacteriaceae bacterium]MBN2838389.1 (d)CMP kinase [Fusobacteriaceae bacterium]